MSQTADRYRALVTEANARGLHIYLSIREEDIPRGVSLDGNTLRFRSIAAEDDIEAIIDDAALHLDWCDRFVVPENRA